jgi:hypothetical protein
MYMCRFARIKPSKFPVTPYFQYFISSRSLRQVDHMAWPGTGLRPTRPEGGLLERGGEELAPSTWMVGVGFMRVGPGGLLRRSCNCAADGLRGRPWLLGVIGRWGLY